MKRHKKEVKYRMVLLRGIINFYILSPSLLWFQLLELQFSADFMGPTFNRTLQVIG